MATQLKCHRCRQCEDPVPPEPTLSTDLIECAVCASRLVSDVWAALGCRGPCCSVTPCDIPRSWEGGLQGPAGDHILEFLGSVLPASTSPPSARL